MAQAPEKRHFSRIPFQAQVHITHTNADGTLESWDTSLMDISLNGALVAQPDNWQSSASGKYLMALDLPNSSVEIKMEVTIAHIGDGRIGLQCQHIDLDSITHLRRLVELNLGNTSLLNRQLGSLG